MQLRPSFAFQTAAALLAAYSFFSLSVTAERTISQRTLLHDPTPTVLPTPSQNDSLAEREQMFVVNSPSPVPVDPVVIEHGSRKEKIIALTFDACSTHDPSSYDERVTSVLIQTGTPATLFLGGKWMSEEAEQTKRLAANSLFELGNHTYLHPHLRDLSDRQIREELQSTQNLMDSLTGKRASLFRPPYGEYDDRVVRIAAEMGLKTIQFDLASGDPDPGIGKDRLVNYVSSMARSGSIVVMHINRRGWHTADALPEIILRLRQRGFVFKTVGDMLRLPPESGRANNNQH